jgi:hypothetical protein
MVNLDLATGLDLDLVIVSAPMSDRSSPASIGPDTFWRQVMRVRLHSEVAALRRTGVAVATVEPGRRAIMAMGLNPMDARRRGPVSRAARQGVHEWLTGTDDGAQVAATLALAASAPARRMAGGPDLRRRPSA